MEEKNETFNYTYSAKQQEEIKNMNDIRQSEQGFFCVLFCWSFFSGQHVLHQCSGKRAIQRLFFFQCGNQIENRFPEVI